MARFYQSARRQSAGKAFLEAGSRKVTYGEFCTDIGKFSSFLAQSGLEAGDRVIISTADPYHTSLLFMGLVDNGLVPVIATPYLKATEFNLIHQTVAASACIMNDTTLADCVGEQVNFKISLPVRQIVRKKSLMRKLLAPKKTARSVAENHFPALLDDCEVSEPDQSWPSEHEAYIIMTSGSTSSPKAVVIHHEALFSHLDTLRRKFGYDGASRLFNILPLYHVDGLIHGPAAACMSGATWLRPFPFTIPNLEPMLLSLYRLHATHLITVPTVLSLIMRLGGNNEDCFDYDEFEFVISSAGYLEAELWAGFQSKYQVRIANFYGLSETVTGAIFSGPDDASYRVGSIGKPMDCLAKIVTEDGSELPANETGELLLKGSNVFRGYIGAGDANDGVFLDGWLRTGDLVHCDDQGLYYFDGRIKNVVISGGENIYPEEVSEVINRYPQVAESWCFGVEHSEWGEILVAVVVPEGEFCEEDMVDWMEGQLSHYKMPRKWLLQDSLPRGPSGKVLVPELRQILEQQSSANAPGVDGDIRNRVFAIAAETFKVAQSGLSDESSPETTRGWDSLAHVEFLLALETEFKLKLSGSDIAEITNLRAAQEKIETLTRR